MRLQTKVALMVLAIVLLSFSFVAMANSQSSPPNSNVGDKIVEERIDGEIFVLEMVSGSIYKVTTIYPNGTEVTNWLKLWTNGGTICCDVIPPPE